MTVMLPVPLSFTSVSHVFPVVYVAFAPRCFYVTKEVFQMAYRQNYSARSTVPSSMHAKTWWTVVELLGGPGGASGIA